MLHKRTWVLVANGSKARIFSFLKDSLTELTVLTHPETRMHGHDLVTDRSGQSLRSGGLGHHSMEPRIQPHKNETEHFAQEVSHYLDLEYKMNQFRDLHLIASPAFLGLLRQHLHTETQKGIVTTIDKDLVGETPRQIRSYLP